MRRFFKLESANILQGLLLTGGLRLKELSARVRRRESYVCSDVKLLVEKGFAKKSRKHGGVIQITEAGESAYWDWFGSH